LLADWLTDCDADRLMLCERGRLAPLTETICEIVWLRDLDCDFDCDSDFDVDMDFDWLKLCEMLSDLLAVMLTERDRLPDLDMDCERLKPIERCDADWLRLCDLLWLVDCEPDGADTKRDTEADWLRLWLHERLSDAVDSTPHASISYVI